jgi:hypothetical protein
LIFFIGTSLFATTVSLEDVGVKFDVPDNFTPLSEKEISKHLKIGYSPGSQIPDTIGDPGRKIIIVYKTYVARKARHKANLRKEKKDIVNALKKRGNEVVKSDLSKKRGLELLLIEYIGKSNKRHTYRFYIKNKRDKSVLYLEIAVKESDEKKLKPEIEKIINSIKS